MMLKTQKERESILFQQELEKMDKKELVELVTMFAPENYRKKLVVPLLSKNDIDEALQEIEKRIKIDMRSETLFYNSESVEDRTIHFLDELSVHVHQDHLWTFKYS